MAGCRCAHGQTVEPGTRERSAGVDRTLSSAQLTESEGAAWVWLQHSELGAVGRDASLGEGGQAGHVVMGTHTEGQRQQAVLQCGRAAGAAVLGAATEAGPEGDTDKLIGLPSNAPQFIPMLLKYLACICHC